MPPSLFSRVTKYRDSSNSSPRENQLTEAFAVVLTEVDGLAADLVTSWYGKFEPGLSWTPGPPVKVGTQRFVRSLRGLAEGYGFVDLELNFGDIGHVLRIEVKHGTSLHDDQVERYREDGSTVMVLAPTSQLGELRAQAPGDTLVATWQQTYRLLNTYREHVSDPKNGWILDQFLKFLREEDLMAIDRIDQDHLAALRSGRAAEDALDEIRTIGFQLVAELSDQQWTPTASGRGRTSRDHYQIFSGINHDLWSAEAGTYLECKTIDDLGGVQFRAGITGTRGAAIAPNDEARALRDALARRDDWDDATDDMARLVRVASATELFVAGESIEQQAKRLADWVSEAFEALSRQSPD